MANTHNVLGPHRFRANKPGLSVSKRRTSLIFLKWQEIGRGIPRMGQSFLGERTSGAVSVGAPEFLQ